MTGGGVFKLHHLKIFVKGRKRGVCNEIERILRRRILFLKTEKRNNIVYGTN